MYFKKKYDEPNLEKVLSDYKKDEYNFDKKYLTNVENFFPDNYIYDENKTVKENREWVREANEMVQKRIDNRKLLRRELEEKLVNDIIEAFTIDYNINKQQSQYVYDLVVKEYKEDSTFHLLMPEHYIRQMRKTILNYQAIKNLGGES